MGKLIVFEGTDGSGKSTQFSLLTRRLEARGVDFRTMVFPQYTEPSSALIRMYLGGEFGARTSTPTRPRPSMPSIALRPSARSGASITGTAA